jgi:hypothetical protein
VLTDNKILSSKGIDMPKQTLALHPEMFTIHSLPDHAPIPAVVFSAPIYFIGKTHDELSIVIPASIKIISDDSDTDWRALELLGPLSLSMVGIMAQIGSVLAKVNVSIFVLSTFETDFFLIKQAHLDTATQALISDGYKVNH